jgi:hypothetical protein
MKAFKIIKVKKETGIFIDLFVLRLNILGQVIYRFET